MQNKRENLLTGSATLWDTLSTEAALIRQTANEETQMSVISKTDSKDELHGTVTLLRHVREFLRSDCAQMIDPRCSFRSSRMDKEEAQRYLKRLVLVAINRRAGIPDVSCRKQQNDYQTDLRRDVRAIHDWTQHRVRSPKTRFCTDLCQGRYGHLLVRDE